MTFDLSKTFQQTAAQAGAGADFESVVNPRFAKVLRLIGFDKRYERALGAHLWDQDGNRYLDMIGGYAVCNIGRNHPTVVQALTEAMSLQLPNWIAFEAPPLAGALAHQLVTRAGRGLDRVFFTNSGAEGIEAAIKFSRCATGRSGLVACDRGFHGLTTGALSLNGCESFRGGFGPLLDGARLIPYADSSALERELSKRDVSAFVVEPIQGKGVHIPPAGWLAEAGRICHRHGTLLVVDEVQTGLGRTGKFLAIDHEESAEPDIVVLSKGLSGGLVPVGALLCRKRVWEATFSSLDRAIVHSSTFHMGTLAMTAGLATLSVLDDERLGDHATAIGARLAEGVRALACRSKHIGEVRQRGLMIGIDIVRPSGLAAGAAWGLVHAADSNLFTQAVVMPLMADHRILTQVAGHGMDVLKLTPPLCLQQADIEWFLGGLETTLRKLGAFGGPVLQLASHLGRNALAHGLGKSGGNSRAGTRTAAGDRTDAQH